MLNKIIKYSLDNRLVILTLTVLLVIAGYFVSRDMEVDVFPDLTAPTVVVMTEANGMAPEEVERSITFPIETVVNGAANVRRVRSSSQVGLSTVWVEFEWGMNQLDARQIVSEKLMSVAEQMPQGVSAPVLAPQSSLLGEVYTFALTADSITDPMQLRTLLTWTIRPRLLALGGVAQVTYLGGEEKEFLIQPNPEKLKFFNTTLSEVIETVNENNRNASGGIINQYGNEYVVRGMGRSSTTEELGSLLVKRVGETSVRLRDVADIEIGAAPKIGEGSYRGSPAIIATITKQPNINTLELTQKLQATLTEMQKTLPADVKIHTDIFNQGEFIDVAVNNVGRSLMEGSIFVVIILFFFLWNFRTTVISLTAIPLSLLTTILILKALGITINTMTLGGMAIAIGSLVDDAIIDVENVYKRLKENAKRTSSEKLPALKVILNASIEIRASILNATMIIIVAFIPLFFLSGMEGRMLKPLGIAYITALFASLLVALTLTPVMCSLLLTNEKKYFSKNADGDTWVYKYMKSNYLKMLDSVMHHKKMFLGGAIVLFICSLFVLSTFGRGFLPPFNEGQITVLAMGSPGISLEESNSLGEQVEKTLLKIPEVKTTARRTGRAELAEHSLGTQVSEIDVPFTLTGRSKDEFVAEVREKIAGIPGIVTEISQPVSHRIDAMLSGTGANIAVKIFGNDLRTLFKLGNTIKTEIAGIEGIADLNVEQQIETPQLQIIPNKEMLAQYGMTLGEFNNVVQYGIAGGRVGEVFEDGASFGLVIRMGDSQRGSIEAVKNILVDVADGQKIPLSMLADVKSTSGPNTISRENVQRKLVISVNVAGRDVGSVVDEISEKVDQFVTMPEGYHVEYGGSFESEKSASRTLMITSLVALLVIFLLLYMEFKNVKLSALIMVNLPLALIGGIVAVWLSSGVLSIPSIIGFITLLGVATRNGILLVSHYQHLEGEGKSLDEAVTEGSADRLAPILMTALTAALALIPLAVQSQKAGNEIQSPMAIVILGGLLTSTFLNIFIIPIVYKMMKSKNTGK